MINNDDATMADTWVRLGAAFADATRSMADAMKAFADALCPGDGDDDDDGPVQS